MPTFREAREALLYAFSDNLITDEEFVLLYDVISPKTETLNTGIMKNLT